MLLSDPQEREEVGLETLKRRSSCTVKILSCASQSIRFPLEETVEPAILPWTREAVLNLYRALLRQGRGLRYTDRDFYFTSIRQEFRRNQHLEQLEDKERQLEKGQAFLRSKLGGLV